MIKIKWKKSLENEGVVNKMDEKMMGTSNIKDRYERYGYDLVVIFRTSIHKK
jgi:hypothetical protein